MNDPRDKRTRLLAETLHGDWTGGPAAEMAQRAAAHARRRRASQRTTLVITAAAVVGAVIFAGHRPRSAVPPPPTSVAQRGYEIISDDELVAQLRDRPLLVLPQENGAPKIVLLDR